MQYQEKNILKEDWIMPGPKSIYIYKANVWLCCQQGLGGYRSDWGAGGVVGSAYVCCCAINNRITNPTCELQDMKFQTCIYGSKKSSNCKK